VDGGDSLQGAAKLAQLGHQIAAEMEAFKVAAAIASRPPNKPAGSATRSAIARTALTLRARSAVTSSPDSRSRSVAVVLASSAYSDSPIPRRCIVLSRSSMTALESASAARTLARTVAGLNGFTM
jgi:hypothetical protein